VLVGTRARYLASTTPSLCENTWRAAHACCSRRHVGVPTTARRSACPGGDEQVGCVVEPLEDVALALDLLFGGQQDGVEDGLGLALDQPGQVL
jgi:hypothetical protein